MKSGILKRAQNVLVGGVNSPVRAFRAVGRDPVFISRGKGAKLYDVDGKSYIDYIMSWGPLILGHAHPNVLSGVAQALKKGTSFGATTPMEIELAERIRDAFPSMELVRLVNSGTEACMSAIRLARGYTKRKKIIKFEGCYHGHADFLLVGAGSGAATFGIPDSAGVPEEFARLTIVLPYNNLDMVKKTLERNGSDIAALILEPVVGNMGVVLPQEGFLKGLRDVCSAHGVLLIFDEVITGFRLSYGGAQKIYNIKPDLTCLGKIIGGGFPVGAYGGRKKIMESLSPLGPVYQAGTLAGNPVACTAGIDTLKILSRPGVYEKLEKNTKFLSQSILEFAISAGVHIQLNRAGSIFTVFFCEDEVTDYTSAKKTDTKMYAGFFREMLKEGIYLPPSNFEANFVSLAHTEKEIEKTIAAYRKVFIKISS